ncbi:MAG: Ig-like domain-containing protein, partial [Planctomycetota bacterium]|nr:Ig-like domain-containing protein [Planctomycetota bacterium]
RDDALGSGVHHVTLYVSTDGGIYRIWHRQDTSSGGTAVYEGVTGHHYEFLALATDNAGNREKPKFVTAGNDDFHPDLGATPNVAGTTQDNYGLPPEPSPVASTNVLFQQSQTGREATPAPAAAASEFDVVYAPFSAEVFASGFAQSIQGQIGPMAIVEDPRAGHEGQMLISGGQARNQIWRFGYDGGSVDQVSESQHWVLNYPIFNLAFDLDGKLWATTGGGPLLRLNPDTGAVLGAYGLLGEQTPVHQSGGITMGLAVDPKTGKIYVGSSGGVEIFHPEAIGAPGGVLFERYSADENLRVSSLAFYQFQDADGLKSVPELWATTWPDRALVVRFNGFQRAETVLRFDTDIDSLAFGRSGTALQNLLFVSHTEGSAAKNSQEIAWNGTSELTLVDVVTRRQTTLAKGGSRGDVVQTTSDGRILLSQSGQVDVISPAIRPMVAQVNPPNASIVALPMPSIAITFDRGLYTGKGTETKSAINPANYHLVGQAHGALLVGSITYDPKTYTVYLATAGMTEPDQWTLTVSAGIESLLGMALQTNYVTTFTTISDFTALVDIGFTETRLDHAARTVSFDVVVTNQASYDFQTPLYLVLEPASGSALTPRGASGPLTDGRYLIDLAGQLAGGARLRAGQSTTAVTVTIDVLNFDRVDYTFSFFAAPTVNQAPVIDAQPPTAATVGTLYQTTIAAHDPDGSRLNFLLADGPDGMSVNAQTGLIQWLPAAGCDDTVPVTVYAFDDRGARATLTYTITVVGGNHAPQLAAIPRDEFDFATHTLLWDIGALQAGVYPNVSLHVSDGHRESVMTTSLVVRESDQPPVLNKPANLTVREGDVVRFYLDGADPDGDAVVFSCKSLPAGASLHPTSGLFQWEVGYAQAGVHNLTFTISNKGGSATRTMVLTVLDANGAPVFDPIGSWQAYEEEPIYFQVFALDPDNPTYVPQFRLPDGSLSKPDTTAASLSYVVEGLPTGATFDAQTGEFRWTPTKDDVGARQLTFQATELGAGGLTTTMVVPLYVAHLNHRPEIDAIANITVDLDAAPTVLTRQVRATDADGNPLVLSAENGLPFYPLPDFVTFVDHGDGTGTLTFDPAKATPGDHPIMVVARDDGDGEGARRSLACTYTFIVTFDSANFAPTVRPENNRVALVGQAFQTLLQAADFEQSDLTFQLAGLPAGAALESTGVYGQRRLRWTPAAEDLGPHQVQITVRDNGNGWLYLVREASLSFSLTVLNTNSAPTFSLLSNPTVAEGQPLTINFAALAADADGQTLTYDIDAGSLPAGASLDRRTGLFTWTPRYDQSGKYDEITARVSDGIAEVVRKFAITVTDVNRPPRIVPIPLQYGREGYPVQFAVVGGDPDDYDKLTWSVLSTDLAPGSYSPDREIKKGLFRVSPGYDQAGLHTITFQVQDAAGATDTLDVALYIDNVNFSPIVKNSNHQVQLGKTLSFTVAATDPDAGTTLTYSASGLPDGATLDPATGLFRWTPTAGQLGEHVVRLHVSDGTDTTSESIVLSATLSPVLPGITVVRSPSWAVNPLTPVTLQVLVNGYADIDPASVHLVVAGVEYTLDKDGFATVRAAVQPGKMHVTVAATDVDGWQNSQSSVIEVLDPSDNQKPELVLQEGLAGTALSTATQILGSVTDSNLDYWTLELARLGTEAFVPLARGESVVSSAALFTLDPAAFPAGFYRLRLSAEDLGNRHNAVETVLEIASTSTAGVYREVATDLLVTVGGEQIAIRRSYDSTAQDLAGSCGYGWQLAIRDVDLQLDVPNTGREVYGIYAPLSDGSALYLTTPTGERIKFRFQPQVVFQVPGVTYYRPAWQAVDTTSGYTLQSVDALLMRSGHAYYAVESGTPYHPANPKLAGSDYTLTGPDGTAYEIDSTLGIVRQITPGGTTLQVSTSGLIAADGTYVDFDRDSSGRLQSIITQVGTQLDYTYDSRGNLIRVQSSPQSPSAGADGTGTVPATTVIHSYGYDPQQSHLLRVSTGATVNRAIFYAGGVTVTGLTANLGNIADSSGQRYSSSLASSAAGDLYAFDVTQEQLDSVAGGELWVRIHVLGTTDGFRPAMPAVEGAVRVHPAGALADPNAREVFAIFKISSPGSYLVRIAAAQPGDYELEVGVAGDINADGRVDGFDSQLFAAAFGTNAVDANYLAAADLDGDGRVAVSDQAILLINYGFRSSEDQAYWTGATGGSAGRAPANSPSASIVDGTLRVPISAHGVCGLLCSSPSLGEDIATTAIANGNFNVVDPRAAAFGWRLRGNTSLAQGTLVLGEHAQYISSASQSFFVPAGATTLRFELVGGLLHTADALPTEAFQVSLLTPVGQAFQPDASQSPLTDAILTIQSDGTVHHHSRLTLTGITAETPFGSADHPIVVEIDLTGVAAGTELLLYFDLLGFGALDSQVSIDNVVVLRDSSSLPTANPDSAIIDEDIPIAFDVLANDTDADGTLDRNSVAIVQQPRHGTAAVDIGSGVVTYTPYANYSGADSFTYTVCDNAGNTSSEALVSLTITPVADTPILSAKSVAGTINSSILLDITSQLRDTDGSETLTIEISGLPAGSFLSAGTQTRTGTLAVYQLTPEQLDGLTITPPLGSTETIVLHVSATAQETQTQERKTAFATISVLVTPVVADPVQIQKAVVNNGEAQRSTIHTIALQFNQDVNFFHGFEKDVIITSATGEPFPLTADNYTYLSDDDTSTYTLTIDTSHVQVEDGHYTLILVIDGVRGVADPGSRLNDIDTNPNDGRLTLEYHQLVADFSGGDSVDHADYDSFLLHYPSRYGDAKYSSIFDLNNDRRIDSIDYGIWRTAQGRTTDIKPPQILIGLQADTGSSATDGVTNDPTIIGIVSDTSAISALYISLDGRARISAFGELGKQDGATYQVPSNYFQLTRAELECYFGGLLADGTHTIAITAVDVHYNTSLPIEFTFTLDTVAPGAPGTPDLMPESDTGISDADNLTSDALPTFRVTGAGGVLVTLYRDDRSLLRAAVDAGASQLSGANLGFADGTLHFSATTSDLAGNESPRSGELIVRLDLTPPKRPTFDLDPASDSSTLPGDTLGDRQTTYATVTLIGKTEPGASVSLAGTALAPVAADPVSGEYRFSGVPLQLGNNPFTVEARDAAGNVSRLATSIRRLGLELNAPDIRILGLQTDSGPDPHDHVTNDPTIVGQVYEENGLSVLKLGIDQDPNVDIRGWLDVAGQFVLTAARWTVITGHVPTDGVHTVRLYAEDEFTNAATREFLFTLDTLAPPTPISLALYADGQITQDTGPDPHDGITNRSVFTLVASCETGSIVQLDRTYNGQTVSTQRWATSEVELFNVGYGLDPLADGTYNFQSTVTDLAGNAVQSAVYRVIVDTLTPLTPTLVFEGVDATGRTVRDRVAVTGQTDSGILVELYRVGWDSVPTPQPIAVATSNATGVYRFDPVMLSLGQNALTLIARDWAGNTATVSDSVYSTADDISPPLLTATLLHDAGFSATDRITNDATLSGTVDDASSIAGLFVSVDGASAYDWKARVAEGRFVLSPSDLAVANGGTLRDGQHRVQIVAQDEKGLRSEVTTLDFTLDTVRPPRPSSPDLLTADDSGASRYDNVTYVKQQTFQLLAEPNTKVRLYANGQVIASQELVTGPITLSTTFSVDNTYLITATAEDLAGNISEFALPLRMVLDTAPPTTPTLQLAQTPAEFTLGPNHTTRQTLDLTGTTEPNARVDLYRGTHGSSVGWLSEAVQSDVGWISRSVQSASVPSSSPAADPLIAAVTADAFGHYTFPNVDLTLNNQQSQDNPLTVESRDTAGNLSRSLVTFTTHDLDAPTITLSLQHDTGSSAEDQVTSDPTVDVLIADASALSAVRPVRLKLDGADAWTDWPIDFRFTVSDFSSLLPVGKTLADGVHYLMVNAVDKFGQSNFGSVLFTLDREAPQPAAPRVVEAYDRGPHNDDGVTNVTAPWVTVDAQAGDYVKWYVDGKLLTGTVSSELAILKVQLPKLLEDPHQITVIITDQAGNVSELSPALNLIIDTTPITTVQFTIGLSDDSDTQLKGDGHTTEDHVNLTGVTEPGAVISISGTKIVGEANAFGVFVLQDVPLAVGQNALDLVVVDLAGNISHFGALVLLDDKPQLTVQLANDTAILGGTNTDGLTSDPTVTGQLFGPSPVVALSASIDASAQNTLIDVSASIAGDSFTLAPEVMERINGAPLAAGAHVVTLIASDALGRQSSAVTLAFTYDPGPEFDLAASATRNPTSGIYTYTYSLTNTTGASATGMDWTLEGFRIPLAPTTTLSHIFTPAQWSSHYSPGDGFIRWTPNSLTAAIDSGETLAFGFDTATRLGAASCEVVAHTGGEDETRVERTVSFGPVDGTGAALYDRFVVDEGATLQGNLLANDLGSNLVVRSLDQGTDWHTTIEWSADGSFTYAASSTVYGGLSQGETVTDRFAYTLSDGSSAFVDVTIRGVNSAPIARPDIADKGAANNIYALYVYADETLDIPVGLLLSNDTDPDVNDRLHLKISAVTPTAQTQGTITFDAQANVIHYDPARSAVLDSLKAGETADDTFQYTLEDRHGAAAIGMVRIHVLSKENLPPKYTSTPYQVMEDGTTAISVQSGLFNGASDVDVIPGYCDELSIAAETVTSEHGSIVKIYESGAFAYTASAYFQSLGPGQTGLDIFTFTLRDERGGATLATATIQVQGRNDAPIAVFDEFAGAYEKRVFIGSGLLDNDVDIDGNTLVAFAKSNWYYDFSYMNEGGANQSPVADEFLFDPTEVSQTTTSQLGVQVTIYPDGTFTYEPNGELDWLGADETTTDYFQYWIHDSISEAVADVEIFIGTRESNRSPSLSANSRQLTAPLPDTGGVNDAPVARNDGPYSTKYDKSLTIDDLQGLLRNDSDPDQNETALLRVDVSTPWIISTEGAIITLEIDGGFRYDPTTLSDATKALLAAGADLVDEFSYTALDPHNTPSAPATATVVLKARESPYALLTVAKTSTPTTIDFPGTSRETTYYTLGNGPSINNNGVIAFTGTVDYGSAGEKGGNVFAYYPPGLQSTSQAVRALMHEVLMLPLPKDPAEEPSQQFGDSVQINDGNEIIAWRNSNYKVLIGTWQFGPVFLAMSIAQMGDLPLAPFSYVEQWNADEYRGAEPAINVPFYKRWYTWTGGESGVARAVYGMGDADTISVGSIALGNPLFADMLYSGLMGILPGMVGAAMGMSSAFDYQPKLLTLWFLNPVWGGTWPSPCDPNNAFQIVYRGSTINNDSESVYTGTTGGGIGATTYEGNVNYIVTALHDAEFTQWATGLPSGADPREIFPKLADDGRYVFSLNNTLYALSYDNPTAPPMTIGAGQNFTQIGPYPSITDDGSLIVFTGEHSDLGRGLFVADPKTGAWAKIAGETGDGHLDPGETIVVDFDGDSELDPGELDIGPFKTIPVGSVQASSPIDSHLSINKMDAADAIAPNRYQIAFMTEDSYDTNSLYTLEFEWAGESQSPDIVPPLNPAYVSETYVLGIGKILPEVSATPISEIRINDAINKHGELAFYVKDSNGTQAIVASSGMAIDLDVDSNNSGVIDMDNSVNGKDDWNEASVNLPGLVVPANWGDVDKDKVLDYQDYNGYGKSVFDEIRITIPQGLARSIDWDKALVRIEYDASPPTASAVNIQPEAGLLRIWTTDGSVSRKPEPVADGGGYLAPGVYLASKLGLRADDLDISFYIEGIFNDHRDGSARAEITMSIDVDGEGGLAAFGFADTVVVSEPQNYVVIFMGGVKPEFNYPRYYENLKDIHDVLIKQGNVSAENISILYADGRGPNGVSDMQFAGASPVYEATRDNLEAVLGDLAKRVTKHDYFLFYSYDHGAGLGADKLYPKLTAQEAYDKARNTKNEEMLCAWGGCNISDSDLRSMLGEVKAGYNSYIFAQCFSGGMLDNVFKTNPEMPGAGTYIGSKTDGLHYFGMASSNHFEYSWGGFAAGFVEAIKSQSSTYKVFAYAKELDGRACNDDYEDNSGHIDGEHYLYDSNFGGVPKWRNQIEHPWYAGDDFAMFYSTSASVRAASPLVLESRPYEDTDEAVSLSTVAVSGELTTASVIPFVEEAIKRFIDQSGIVLPDAWRDVLVTVADLPGGQLGETSGNTMTFDIDGGGYGWFVDDTPWDDSEFYASRLEDGNNPAVGHVDLLSVVMHELGHLAGLSDTYDYTVMHESLPVGVRRTRVTPVQIMAVDVSTAQVRRISGGPEEDVSGTPFAEPTVVAPQQTVGQWVQLAPMASPIDRSPGSDFFVNTTTADYQEQPAVALRNDGSYVVVWSSYYAEGGIYGKLFNSDGTVAKDEFLISNITAGVQVSPDVAVDPVTGAFVVTWQNDAPGSGQTPGSSDVYARAFTSDGTPVGEQVQLSDADGDHFNPAVAFTGSGEFVVAWDSFAPANENKIFARHFTEANAVAGPPVEVSTGAGGMFPDVGSAGDGSFVVTWESTDGNGRGILMRRFQADDTPIGAPVMVNGTAQGDQTAPVIAVAPDGSFVVAWCSEAGDTTQVLAQQFSANGNPVGAELRVDQSGTVVPLAPAVTILPTGGFLVAWTELSQSGSDREVRAREFKADGTPESDPFALPTTSAGDQEDPDVAAVGTTLVAVWAGESAAGGDLDIFGRTFSVGEPTNNPPTVALTNTVTTLPENTEVQTKVADIVVTDDGLGTNTLSLTGPDMAMFEIIGSSLYLKAGQTVDFETHPQLHVTVNVDDVTVGTTPDASVSSVLSVVDVNEPPTAVTLTNTVTS